METRQIKLAIRLSETLHFGRAAELEDIAQSVLSTQIAKLEKELGFKIFERATRRVELTRAGDKFVTKAKELVGELSGVISECKVLSNYGCQPLKVGFFADGAGELTHKVLELYREAEPNTQVVFCDLHINQQINALIDGAVDVAFMRLPIDDDRFDYDVLFDEPRVAVVPASHSLADANTISISDLFDQPFAVPDQGMPANWASYWSLDKERNEPCRIGANVRSIPEILAAIAYKGVFDTFPLATSRQFSHPGICYVPLPDAPRSGVALVSLRGKSNDSIRSLKRCARYASKHHLGLVSGANFY